MRTGYKSIPLESIQGRARAVRGDLRVRCALGILAAALAILPLTFGASGKPHNVPTTVSDLTLNNARSLNEKIQELSQPPDRPLASYKPIVITDEEANSYLKVYGHEFLPPGVQNPVVQINAGSLMATADIDFDELNQAGAKSGDWGMKALATIFKGRQKLTATGKLDTANGQGTALVQNVSIGSTVIPDALTKLLIEYYVQDRYNVDLSKPFVLPDHVTQIQLVSGRAIFVRSPKKGR